MSYLKRGWMQTIMTRDTPGARLPLADRCAMNVATARSTRLLIIFGAGWLVIGLAILSIGWELTWKILHVPPLTPIFADMRTIQAALISHEQGFDPQLVNPADPWQRRMNYPSLWLAIGQWAQLDRELPFLIFALAWALAYLVANGALLRRFPSWWLLLAIFSGASLLSVERANNDIVVFALLVLGLSAPRAAIGLACVLLATLLKLYPAAALIRFRNQPRLFLIGTLLAGGYFIAISGELAALQSGNTAQEAISYGIGHGWRWLVDRTDAAIRPIWLGLAVAVSIAVGWQISHCLRRQPAPPAAIRESLLTGGSIFVATYLVTLNWDYRLIFLLLCIPYLTQIEQPWLRRSLLISLLIASNINALRWHLPADLVELISLTSKHYLFLGVAAALVSELRAAPSDLWERPLLRRRGHERGQRRLERKQ